MNRLFPGRAKARRFCACSGLTYLIRDQFATDAAAPLTTPRTCEPGPGTLTLVQTDGQFSIVGGAFTFPAQGTPVWGNQGAYGASLARVAGRALLGTLRFSALGANGGFIGFGGASAVFTDLISAGIFWYSGGVAAVLADGSTPLSGALATATDYQCAVILRATGSFVLIKGGAFTNWALLWVDAAGSGATGRPKFGNKDLAGTLDDFRVLDLPAFATDPYTENHSGSQSAGQTFVHAADGQVEWIETTRPSAASTLIFFRYQDASNYWQAEVNSSGDFLLKEVVAGVPTTRGTASAVVSSGHRCVVSFNGTTIRGFSNNAARWTYASAANFQSATAGQVNALGTSGVVSNLISWPRDMSALIPAGA